jgi:hypothetical protein
LRSSLNFRFNLNESKSQYILANVHMDKAPWESIAPLCNTMGKNMKRTDEDKYFSPKRITNILENLG